MKNPKESSNYAKPDLLTQNLCSAAHFSTPFIVLEGKISAVVAPFGRLDIKKKKTREVQGWKSCLARPQIEWGPLRITRRPHSQIDNFLMQHKKVLLKNVWKRESRNVAKMVELNKKSVHYRLGMTMPTSRPTPGAEIPKASERWFFDENGCASLVARAEFSTSVPP